MQKVKEPAEMERANGASPLHGCGCNGKGILHIRCNWPMFCWWKPAPMFHCCHIVGMQDLDNKQSKHLNTHVCDCGNRLTRSPAKRKDNHASRVPC